MGNTMILLVILASCHGSFSAPVPASIFGDLDDDNSDLSIPSDGTAGGQFDYFDLLASSYYNQLGLLWDLESLDLMRTVDEPSSSFEMEREILKEIMQRNDQGPFYDYDEIEDVDEE